MNIGGQNAIKILLTLLTLVIVLHLLIVIKVIPYKSAWGGRLETDEQMYMFEAISIIFNLLLSFILLIKGRFLQLPVRERLLNVILWIFLVLFSLNTIGNLFAQTNLEKLFAFVTFVFAFLIWVVIRSKVIDHQLFSPDSKR